ncbi:MAG: efflux RND transporter periplasmic adaptor subunit [Candidatus Sericytochromatia bacterium]|nr:efflux RND transporter periplasmic adaptor subunit [Candidatus Sericytochromatia bacterium]
MSEKPSAKPRSRWWWVAGLAGIVVIGGAFVVVRKPFAAKVETVTLERRTLREEVEISGTVEARRNVTLKAEATGPITALTVIEGVRVAAGATLLTIDPETARLQWEQAQRNTAAQVAAAQTELSGAQRALAEAESRQQTAIRTLTNDVARTETALAQAERDTATARRLAAEGAVSRSSADQAETQLQQAHIALKAARDTLGRARTDFSEVVTARNRVAAATTTLGNARRQGQIAVELAVNVLAKATLRAPFAGTVTGWTLNKGDYVAPGTPLGNFQDLNDLVLKLPVDETDLPKMQPNGAVTITFDAFPDKPFNGRIRTIGTASAKVKDVMVFPVEVRFDDPGHLIRPGMSGDAAVLVSERQNVVAVPLKALRRQGGKYHVGVTRPVGQAKASAKASDVVVEAGIVTLDYLEARSGVAAGDEILAAGPPEAPKTP